MPTRQNLPAESAGPAEKAAFIAASTLHILPDFVWLTPRLSFKP
jgi:hypothetical protein